MILAVWLAVKVFFGGFSFRAWLILAAVAAFAFWSVYLFNAGYSVADAKWQAKALEAKVAKLELEIKTQKDADAAEDKLRDELEAENEQQKKVIDTYVEELKSRPDKCLLGPDAGRLQ
jgi:hypothetical protein